MLVCRKCGSKQPEGMFCDQCGARLEPDAAICAHCGQPLIEGYAFCHICGRPVGSAPVGSAPVGSAPVGSASVGSAPAATPAEPPPDEATPLAQPASAQTPQRSGHAPAVDTLSPSATPIVEPPPSEPSASSADQSITLDLPDLELEPGIPGSLQVCDSKRTICFPEGQFEAVIGRRDPYANYHPDIDLADEGAAQKGVSRQHACITYRDAQVYIEDLGSSNGTYVNQRQLKAKQPHRLHDRDTIWLGHLRLIFIAGDPSP